jgi:8-oxo-dGTP pyrophosphatase MutT (NUDIX family)
VASLGPGNYVVVVLPIRGSKARDTKLVLQGEPRSGKTWFPTDSILPNEEHVDAAVRELFEETSVAMTIDAHKLVGALHLCKFIHNTVLIRIMIGYGFI